MKKIFALTIMLIFSLMLNYNAITATTLADDATPVEPNVHKKSHKKDKKAHKKAHKKGKRAHKKQ